MLRPLRWRAWRNPRSFTLTLLIEAHGPRSGDVAGHGYRENVRERGPRRYRIEGAAPGLIRIRTQVHCYSRESGGKAAPDSHPCAPILADGRGRRKGHFWLRSAPVCRGAACCVRLSGRCLLRLSSLATHRSCPSYLVKILQGHARLPRRGITPPMCD